MKSEMKSNFNFKILLMSLTIQLVVKNCVSSKVQVASMIEQVCHQKKLVKAQPLFIQTNESFVCAGSQPVKFLFDQIPMSSKTQLHSMVSTTKIKCTSFITPIYTSTLILPSINSMPNVSCIYTSKSPERIRRTTNDLSNSTEDVAVDKPKLDAFFRCRNVHGKVRLTIVCKKEERNQVFRHDLEDNNLCIGDICDHDTYDAIGTECPKTIFVCTVKDSITGQTNSHQFTPQECQDFVLNNSTCHSNETAAADSGSKGSLIVNIAVPLSVVGLILFAVIIFAICWKSIREKLKMATLNMLSEEEIQEFLKGTKKIDPNDVHAVIHSQPFDIQFEIERPDLSFDDQNLLGSGHYGLVMKGKLSRENSSTNSVPERTSAIVAVKTLKASTDVLYVKALLSEVKIMMYLGKHENIVEFIGACTTNMRYREIFVVIEYCGGGDMHKCLRGGRKNFQDLWPVETEFFNNRLSTTTMLSNVTTSSTNTVNVDIDNYTLSTLKLLQWSRDIANGMAYISSKKVIHGDLAARNILITGDYKTAKISDFGLSRQLANYSNYFKSEKVPLPYKWMALESLTDMKFSSETDVWAYGVALFEIFSLGLNPYPGCEWDSEFVEKINQGYRMKKPKYANLQVYNIMMDCWKLEPDERPTFIHIFNKFQTMISKLQGIEISNDYVCCG